MSDRDLYDARFDEREVGAKDKVWREIVGYLQRYVTDDAPVLDIGCDRGHFIRWVKATERWASDIRDVSTSLPADVHFVQSSGLDLDSILPTAHFGTVFMSNYLEHLDSSESVIAQLRVAATLLRPGGRLVVLQPNIRLVGVRYWDFIDHKVPLTDRSLVEAATVAGFSIDDLIVRFLPYSTKGRLPVHWLLVRLYLKLRFAWPWLGKQSLLVGRR